MKTGDHLERLVSSWLGVEKWAGCGCTSLRDEMNTHMARWASLPANFNRIVNKMVATAKKNPDWRQRILGYLPGVSRPVRALVWTAIYLAERDERAEATPQTHREPAIVYPAIPYMAIKAAEAAGLI